MKLLQDGERGDRIPIGIYRDGRFFAVHATIWVPPRLISDDAK